MCKERSVQQIQVEEKPKTSKIKPLHAAIVMSTPKHLRSCEDCTDLDNHSFVSSATGRLSTGGVPSNGQAKKPQLPCAEAPQWISSTGNYSRRQVGAGYHHPGPVARGQFTPSLQNAIDFAVPLQVVRKWKVQE